MLKMKIIVWKNGLEADRNKKKKIEEIRERNSISTLRSDLQKFNLSSGSSLDKDELLLS